MIRYSLRCACGHGFESWFKDGAAYDRLAAAGALVCPACGGGEVEKAIMAPAVARSDREVGLREAAALRAARKRVLERCEDVGDRFAAEARSIHRGEAERRDIRGRATIGEAKALLDDGVPFAALPPEPDENA